MFRIFFSKFFQNHSFGLNISHDAIRLIELSPAKNGPTLGRFREHKIPTGVIQQGGIKDLNKLEKILLSLKKDFGFKFVRVSLTGNLMHSANDLGLLFKKIKVSVSSFEPEAKAISRAVFKKGDPDTYMILNFSKEYSDIFITTNGVIKFVSTFQYGGSAIIDAIKEKFAISPEEAEKIKKEHGLNRNAEGSEVFKTISNSLAPLRDELAKFFLHWHTKKGKWENRPPIKNIILCGSESGLLGLSEYLAVSLRTEVKMADVWVNISGVDKNVPKINRAQSFSFTSAIGAARGYFIINPLP